MLFIICFNSCANKKQSLDQSISIGNLVNEYAFTSKAYDTTILPKNLKTLDSFYTATTVQSIWFDDSLLLNKTGENFINILHNANQYGLDPKQYSVDKIQRIYHIIKESKTIKNRKELASLLGELLTKNYFIFGKHLNYGLIENVDILTTLSRKEFVINMPDYLLMAYKKDKHAYLDQFIRHCFAPYDVSGELHHIDTKSSDLDELLNYTWEPELLGRIADKGTHIKVYFGGDDKIIDVQSAREFFKPYATVYFIKKANHFLRGSNE